MQVQTEIIFSVQLPVPTGSVLAESKVSICAPVAYLSTQMQVSYVERKKNGKENPATQKG
jgi:hypothetical protein